jgi:hypothetical protein
MLNFRTLLMAAGLSVGVAFAMPATSQAMPQIAPIKVDAAKDSNIVDVRHKKRWKRWAHRYYNPYYEPYYGYYEPYPYYYGRRFYGPGIGFSFRF